MGHCSVEDSRAAMDLYKLVGDEWEKCILSWVSNTDHKSNPDNSLHYMEDQYWPGSLMVEDQNWPESLMVEDQYWTESLMVEDQNWTESLMVDDQYWTESLMDCSVQDQELG